MTELTEAELMRLRKCLKRIKKPFGKEWRDHKGTLKNDAVLTSVEFPEVEFKMFARKLKAFPENFSVGLDFIERGGRRTPLTRCNGMHDRVEREGGSKEHCVYHIHYMTASDANAGSTRPARAEVTDAYSRMEEALLYFITEINIDEQDLKMYFPDSQQPSMGLFSEAEQF